MDAELAEDAALKRASPSVAGAQPPRKRKRKQIRKREVMTIDRRSVLGKRVTELEAVFTAALTDAGAELTTLRKLSVEQAARAVAVSERLRAQWLHTGVGDPANLIATERRADALIRRLGLPVEQPKPAASATSLRDRLASKYGAAPGARRSPWPKRRSMPSWLAWTASPVS